MKGFFRNTKIHFLFCALLFAFILPIPVQAQPEKEMVKLIESMKNDQRGPFQAIKWFCPNGDILSAQERCQSPGGFQHGLLKQDISRLEQERKIYLNMVLASSPHEKIWDNPGHHSRIKQYALLQYLFLADEGWIYRNARYYRGAIQAEDESAWGKGFLKWLLADQKNSAQHFFMVREACRVIPHPSSNQNRFQTIRAVSKTLSELIPGFMNLRVKLHGQPDSGDILKVREFMGKNKGTLDENQTKLFKVLVENLGDVYSANGSASLKKNMSGKIAQIPELAISIKALEDSMGQLMNPVINPVMDPVMDSVNKPGEHFSITQPNPYENMADILFTIRSLMVSIGPDIRLPLMDLSLELERTMFSTIGNWHPQTLGDLMEKCRILAKAAAGCGYMELWEWDAAKSHGLNRSGMENSDKSMDFKEFELKAEQIRRIVDWGTLMVRNTYLAETNLYSQFEPMAQGFVDDRIRSSLLLLLGEAVGKLTRFAQTQAGVSHQLPMGVKPHGVRGLNPGLAHGVLEVITGDPGKITVDSKKIYAFKTIPSELKPVAGMLTVSEGNLVSHVQLLARNLGVPNAVISSENLDSLLAFSGQEMFYAVSHKGSVVLKQETMIAGPERALIQGQKRKQELFRVPVEKIDLTKKNLIPLNRVRADDSGRTCGPKAANLGQLKFMFPDRVVDGIVIPFGIFREHMDQTMPGSDLTFWQFLTKALSNTSLSDAQLVETLSKLQSAIKTMPFLPGFETALSNMFETTLGNTLGNVPVFIRSDTNMEDIKGFTGAGLNLTLFNIRDRDKVFQGIRDVWASPYSERSYLWRQKYLENPENVFPSILLLPSVNVDKSGVIITHGIVSNLPEDITVAFSWGVGGAVDGQTAETFLLTAQGTDLLLYPARETLCTRLPLTGGTQKAFISFEKPVLTPEERLEIRELVKAVRRILPNTPGIEGQGPFDIELGFINGSMRLFQVRPFVENKQAGTLTYLLKLDQNASGSKAVLMGHKIEP